MMKSSQLLLVLALSVAATGQTPRTGPPQPQLPQHPTEAPTAGEVSVQQDVIYGTVAGQKLLLDVYEPGNLLEERPAVVLIHGGAWSSYDKSTMHGMGMFLARRGFVAFSVDYRLLHDKENLWPAQLDDVQRAVRWIRANAGKYRVDSNHIGAFGHSAGAQLAALLGMEDTRDNSDHALAKFSSRVQAVVDVSGPTDFTSDREPDRDAFYAAFLGGDFEHNAEAWRSASPVFHISKKSAPFLIVHGTHDESVPITQAQELAEKLKQAKVPVKLVTVDDAHTFQTQQAIHLLVQETLAFFTEYLRLGN